MALDFGTHISVRNHTNGFNLLSAETKLTSGSFTGQVLKIAELKKVASYYSAQKKTDTGSFGEAFFVVAN